MQNKDIEIFVDLIKTRNITKSSENLFVSQSVISTRLRKLEEELGYDLFVRSKGVREIELTRQGKEFVSIALRLHNLYEEAALLKASTESVLRIACPESVYEDFLEPLTVAILKNHPELKLSVEMLDSSEVYDRMESGRIDFGFASYESTHSGIMHSHIYNQSACLLMKDDERAQGTPVSPSELDASKEIRLIGGNFTNISQWRDTWFPGADRCRVDVSSPNIVAKLVSELGYWAIVPRSAARMFCGADGVRVYELTDAPESRKIYLLRHSGSKTDQTEATRIFEKELALYADTALK